jgi:two-component system, sensor histidine kinase PdtaS
MKIKLAGIAKALVIAALFFFPVTVPAQNQDLQGLLQKAVHDTDKINVIVNYCFEVVENDPDTVVLLCNKALQYAAGVKDSSHHARIYQNLGIAYDIQNNLDSCLFFLHASRNIYKRMGLPLKESFILNDIAIAYHYRGIYEVALRIYYETLALRQQGNDKKLLAQSYNNIGLLYRAKKDYSNAIRFLHHSLQLKKDINDVQGMINTSLNIGSCFQFSKNYDSAYYYANATEILATQHKKPNDITGAVGNKGTALKGLKQFAAAEPLLTRSLKEATESNNTSILLTSLQGLGDIYFEQQQFGKALEQYKQGAGIAAQGGRWKEQQAVFYENMANCYASLKQFDKAYACSRNYKSLQDTLLNEENSRHINEMNVLYETEQKQKQISQLSLDVTKGNIANQQSIKERNYLLLSSVLLLALLVVIFISYRNSRRKTARLNEQNSVIEKALADKEVLLKEIHHRVKNNMQIVSSLLDLQSISIKDSQAAEAMKEGKNRVQSMALIHQNLYQHDNLKGINARDYIEQLLTHLKDSYTITAASVKINTTIDDLNIDVDTMIPIGLMMNELITNVFKYAVPNCAHPELDIALQQKDNILYLKVKDNGPGFAYPGDFKTTKTFGLKMVRAFAQKLKATVGVENKQGALVELFITKYKIT